MLRLILTTILIATPLKAQAFKIISLAPNLTEIVFSAGAGDYLIATDSSSNYPETVKKLPKIGNLFNLNFEEILQLDPDLVLIWQDGLAPGTLNKFRQLNIPVKVFNSHQLEEIPQLIIDIAQATPALEKPAQLKAYELTKNLQKTQEYFSYSAKQNYIIQISDKLTLSKEQFFSQALAVCNLENITPTSQQMAPQINLEEVLQQNPDLIILSGRPQDTQKWQAKWQEFPQLKAVKNNQIHQLNNPDIYHRPTERMLQFLPKLCQQLNPPN